VGWEVKGRRRIGFEKGGTNGKKGDRKTDRLIIWERHPVWGFCLGNSGFLEPRGRTNDGKVDAGKEGGLKKSE